ncbi:unnamed protein product [Orchesella dallaii]|uniref:Protein FAM161A n=1 Tax=Orchesella dallaii TaxID=48710 RepID=A0ABP1QCA6_9HEXA
MKMHKPLDSKSTSDNLIDLYTRIPDYSEVQHLGQSDFINTLEKLKEEFRQCRASLYNEEFCSDSEYLAEKSSPVTNRSRTVDNLCSYSSKFPSASNENRFSASTNAYEGKVTKINNHNLTTGFNNSGAGGSNTIIDADVGNNDVSSAGYGRNREQYLSIKSCELHRTPYRSTSASSLGRPSRYITFGRSALECGKNDTNCQNDYDDSEDDDDDEDDEGYGNNRQGERDRWSVGSSNSDMSLSKWSSNPEIYRPISRGKEYLPPANTEQRLLVRKSQNNSAPSVAFKDESEEPTQTFRANPVPEHVYKPLYEFIMLKNQRRSERIREQSKRRLLAQMKPFSFYKDPNKSSYSRSGKGERTGESLNNTKPLKKRRNDTLGNIKTNNNRLHSASLFRAKPAPPRTKALLAAIKQKEQQEYRELKKRLRSEMLLKNASLPPSMAAREKRTKITNAKIDEVLLDYQKSFQDKKRNRNYRETSTCTDDTGLLTDEDRMTEDEFGVVTTKKITTVVKPFKFSHRSPRNKFTSFGTSRHSAAAEGVFESSSNDNHASRLRYQAAKEKEEIRIQREEEELLRIMRAEKRRQKLRDTHLHAWQHAYSYSAEQDIAMRRQLRHAASILERESFIKDMSCMLSRVRSAPLLLEGGHRLERKQVPCRKHREEFQKQGSSSNERPWNKLSTPRLYSSNNWKHNASSRSIAMLTSLDRYGEEEKSETVALAEGSLSNSDNESGNDDDEDRGRNLILTDSGSEFEDDGNDNDRHEKKGKKPPANGKVAELQRGNTVTVEHNEDNEDNEIRAPSTDKDFYDEVEEEGSEDEEKDEDGDDDAGNNANNTH